MPTTTISLAVSVRGSEENCRALINRAFLHGYFFKKIQKTPPAIKQVESPAVNLNYL